MPQELLSRRTRDGVTTLTFDHPARLNGWTLEMLEAMAAGLEAAASDEATRAVILTGAGEYYSAGVNLGGAIKVQHPAKLHAYIVARNQALFEQFIRFPKPILVAANGPAIGAPVTSATLCDGIIASERATFSTPFARLGVVPEGCSSEVFPALLGAHAAERMLGPEGWAPSAGEALEIGLVQWVVPHDRLIREAEIVARRWIAEGRRRTYPANFSREALLEINARESLALAHAFLSPPFLMGQHRFLWRKKKYAPALTFLALRATHPLWSRLVPTTR